MIPPARAPAFLAAHGWAGAEIRPLAGDASFRRYFRVHGRHGETAVLMDAPPELEDSRPFLAMTRRLGGLGFSAPQPLAEDLDAGLILLEDFGDARLVPALAADPAPERALYETAIDVLVELHRHPADGLAPYSVAELRREVRLFADWYLPAVGLAEAPGYDAAWDALWPLVEAQPPVIVLRDYHADNLMILSRPGVQRLGLLDFQDALAGHPAYDLASLLRDIRRTVSPALETAMLDRYMAARALDRQAFRTAYDVLAAQRNIKILGVFTRLWVRDGKAQYLDFQPRLWELVTAELARPALAPVRAWFDAHVPPHARRGVRP